MTTKILSSVTVAGTLYVFLLSLLRPGDALFLITSSDTGLNLALVVLALFAMYVSYVEKFKSSGLYMTTLVFAVLFLVIGFIGLTYSSIENYFTALVEPVDFIVAMILGVVFSLSALSAEHKPIDLQPVHNYLSLIRYGLSSTKQSAASTFQRLTTPPRTTSSRSV